MLDFEENNADQFISDKSFEKSLLLKNKEFVKIVHFVLAGLCTSTVSAIGRDEFFRR
jgi:hypothetical protein